MRFALRSFAVMLASAALAAPAVAKNYRLVLATADVDRAGQVIAFTLPPDAPKSAVLRAANGRVIALQTDADGTSRFVVPSQKAREPLTFTLTSGAGGPREGVVVAPDRGDLRLSVAGQPVFYYRMERDAVPREGIKPEYLRAGYIHPVFSPMGQLVTDDYPANHPHHHGIWTPWTKTSFQGRSPDFWNMAAKTGAEEFVALDRTWSGPVHGGFEARLKMVDLSAPAPVVALNETWQVTLYDIGGASRPVRMFDLVTTQSCATADPLILPEYHYGGFGFRAAGAWNGPGDAARFLTSEGGTDRIKDNNSRARWCFIGGPLKDGAFAGTATLGHPDNFRSPQPVRLHPNMPYFSFVPQLLGEFRIEPGKPYVARFRFIVADGEPDRALLEAYWNGYAKPAAVKFEPL
ncbi:MAG: PmoA family protein [Verrucomicrobia bacterium]|nr:PmoA family protein [Verrucomicrobiota bacterium]